MPADFGSVMSANSSFFIYIALIIALPLLAQFKVKSAFAKYSKVRAQNNMPGAQVARKILDDNGLHHVQIEMTSTKLGDHYDPRKKVIRLSEENFHHPSIAAAAIAAHECGHAIQDDEGYAFLKFRSALVPVASLGSNLSWFILIAGLLLNMAGLILVGIIFMAFAVLFQLVTLPVEFNASSRAMDQVVSLGIIQYDEEKSARKVLNAAAMTYVAAAAVAVLELMRFILIFLNRRD